MNFTFQLILCMSFRIDHLVTSMCLTPWDMASWVYSFMNTIFKVHLGINGHSTNDIEALKAFGYQVSSRRPK